MMRLIRCFALALASMLALTNAAHAAFSNALFSYTDHLSFTELRLSSASGGTVGVTQVDRGWYEETGFHSPINLNYVAGLSGSSDEAGANDTTLRNWFVFEIPELDNDAYTSAILRLSVPSPNGYISFAPTITYTLYDVETDPDTLIDGTGGVAAFDDLGNGAEFGQVIAGNGSEGTILEIHLNALALASINAHQDVWWAIGGSVTPVPEPSTAVLAALAGCGLLVGRRFRRR